MSEMIYCVYDSPLTYAREVWVDGKLQEAWSSQLIREYPDKFRPWRTGQIKGDIAAVPKDRRWNNDERRI